MLCKNDFLGGFVNFSIGVLSSIVFPSGRSKIEVIFEHRSGWRDSIRRRIDIGNGTQRSFVEMFGINSIMVVMISTRRREVTINIIKGVGSML